MITRNALGVAALLFSAAEQLTARPCGEHLGFSDNVSASGTYTVTKNLTATGTCITITAAADVVIDLHGHTITGNGTGKRDHRCEHQCERSMFAFLSAVHHYR